MTAVNLTRARRHFGLRQNEMARLLQVDPRTYGRWEKGASRIPGLVDAYLSCLLRFAPLREEAVALAKATTK